MPVPRVPTRRASLVARLSAALLAVALLAAPTATDAAPAVGGGRFVTTWEGTVARLCLYGDVDVTIDWGDGRTQRVTGTRGVHSGLGPVTHTFAQAAPTHQVVVTGTFDVLGCAHTSTELNGLLSVDEWGATGTTDLTFGLAYTGSLRSVVEPPPTVTDMGLMFLHSGFDGEIGHWDTSRVTDMYGMFLRSVFNRRIGGWDTSNVATMSYMFADSRFNQPIGDWDVRSASRMEAMFQHARAFNQDLSTWCVTGVTEEPAEFATGTDAWTLPRPPWGSCGRTDSAPPDATITSVRVTDLVLVRGTSGDDTGVARVLCAIQDRATGEWLRRDRSWGAYDRLNAILAVPGATRTTWRLGRRLPPGTYTVKVIAFDVGGRINPAPRPTRIVRVP